jgi:hypothetical protein
MEQAAAYASSFNLNLVTVALFVPVDDEEFLCRTVWRKPGLRRNHNSCSHRVDIKTNEKCQII